MENFLFSAFAGICGVAFVLLVIGALVLWRTELPPELPVEPDHH
jgi:hypothetical protein